MEVWKGRAGGPSEAVGHTDLAAPERESPGRRRVLFILLLQITSTLNTNLLGFLLHGSSAFCFMDLRLHLVKKQQNGDGRVDFFG